jgi:septum formation protein
MSKVPPTLVLASASGARAQILKQAGIGCLRDPAKIDEAVIKRNYKRRGKTADDTAGALAKAKAKNVSAYRPGALVLGADQILECDKVWFDKPCDRDDAATQLKALRGRTHELITAACVVRNGHIMWEHCERTRLTMRPFSPQFLDAYLAKGGKGVLESVGAYRLEGMGVQLFSKIGADYFTILGLPLIALISFLRFQGVLED